MLGRQAYYCGGCRDAAAANPLFCALKAPTSAGKTKAPGVRPKIHKQKSVYTSESDDNNDEPDGSLKLLTNTISKFNKESTEKDGSFVSNANRVVNKKMLRYHKKLQLSLTAKLDSLAAKSSEGQST